MKRAFLLILSVAMLAACGPNRDKEIQRIEESEESLSMMDIAATDSAATDLVALYRQYAAHFPDDSLAPVYMQRAADLCIGIGQADQALLLLDSVITLYPGFEDVAGCWFLKGYAYETAAMYDKARETYAYFADNYPDHYLADDARKSLPYIGMSPEEMFDAIMNASNNDLASAPEAAPQTRR